MGNFDPVTGRLIRPGVLQTIGHLRKTRKPKVGKDVHGNKLTELIHSETGETNGYLTTRGDDGQDATVLVDAPTLDPNQFNPEVH